MVDGRREPSALCALSVYIQRPQFWVRRSVGFSVRPPHCIIM